jgi:hypothetical protein
MTGSDRSLIGRAGHLRIILYRAIAQSMRSSTLKKPPGVGSTGAVEFAMQDERKVCSESVAKG